MSCCAVLCCKQEAEDVNDPACYTPFQHMLQFMTQPLLAASGTHPAGHTAPILLKMCRTIKRCADATVGDTD